EHLVMENLRLSAPFIELTKEVGFIPIFGILNKEQIAVIIEDLLPRIHESDIQTLIMDFNAVGNLNEEGMKGLSQLLKMIQLLGARIIISSLQPKHVRQLHAFNKPI